MKEIVRALVNAPDVAAIAGDGVYRVIAPQGSTEPYVVLSGVAQTPEAYISGAPDIENDRMQVHAWARDFDTAEALAKACRRALQPIGYMAGSYIEDYEPDTKLFRVGFDWSAWTEE